MKTEQKKKNYYKMALEGGICRNGMSLTKEYRLHGSGGGSFFYLAPVFDSMEYGETYHRFRLEAAFQSCKYEIILCATDKAPDLAKRMEDMGKTIRKVNCEDFLLHGLKGRYLLVLIQVFSSDRNAQFSIEGFSVEFPQSSFIEYLPELYQETQDGFFTRYMAALQSLYVDLEKQVEELPALLDYETSNEETRRILADWVGVRNQGEFAGKPENLLFLMKNLRLLQTGKGTKKVLQMILSMYTGLDNYIVEFFKWSDWMNTGNHMENQYDHYRYLYGENETVFTCIINCVEQSASNTPDTNTLMELIRAYIPFGLRCNLILLRKNHHMDHYCYLDVNSYLSTPEQPDTSGFLLGGNYVLG